MVCPSQRCRTTSTQTSASPFCCSASSSFCRCPSPKRSAFRNTSGQMSHLGVHVCITICLSTHGLEVQYSSSTEAVDVSLYQFQCISVLFNSLFYTFIMSHLFVQSAFGKTTSSSPYYNKLSIKPVRSSKVCTSNGH